MKIAKLCLVFVLVLMVVTGCKSRNTTGTTTSSTPTPGSSIAGGVSQAVENAESRIENFASGAENATSRMEEELDLWGDESNPDRTSMRAQEASLAESMSSIREEESAKAAMSTDFKEIGALDTKKLGWGSGGPTDDTGRPEGATNYQQKYGDLSAYFIAPSNQKVYLTFDEGYENGFTPQILDTLKDKNVKAVFFITLDFAKSQPELVQRMIDEGHILGNHSCKHLSFPDMSLEDAAADILKLHNYVKDNFYYEMHLFRPPMGEFNQQVLALVQSLGYKSVFWSFAYKDYDVDNQPLTIEALDTITNKAHPGAIYLLHAVSKTNAEVLGDAIDNIQNLGFTFARWDW